MAFFSGHGVIAFVAVNYRLCVCQTRRYTRTSRDRQRQKCREFYRLLVSVCLAVLVTCCFVRGWSGDWQWQIGRSVVVICSSSLSRFLLSTVAAWCLPAQSPVTRFGDHRPLLRTHVASTWLVAGFDTGFTARRYASAVCAVALCLSFRLSVCHKSMFCQNG